MDDRKPSSEGPTSGRGMERACPVAALRDLALDNMQQHRADRLLQKQEIPKEVLGRIFACFSSFLTYKVENLLVIPEKNTAVIEMRSSGVPKDGMDYENL